MRLLKRNYTIFVVSKRFIKSEWLLGNNKVTISQLFMYFFQTYYPQIRLVSWLRSQSSISIRKSSSLWKLEPDSQISLQYRNHKALSNINQLSICGFMCWNKLQISFLDFWSFLQQFYVMWMIEKSFPNA